MKNPIKVLLADNHPIVRAGIRAELEKLPNVQVLGEANDGREAIEKVKELKPDIVFMDITMPVLNGLEATERITRDCPGCVSSFFRAMKLKNTSGARSSGVPPVISI